MSRTTDLCRFKLHSVLKAFKLPIACATNPTTFHCMLRNTYYILYVIIHAVFTNRRVTDVRSLPVLSVLQRFIRRPRLVFVRATTTGAIWRSLPKLNVVRLHGNNAKTVLDSVLRRRFRIPLTSGIRDSLRAGLKDEVKRRLAGFVHLRHGDISGKGVYPGRVVAQLGSGYIGTAATG